MKINMKSALEAALKAAKKADELMMAQYKGEYKTFQKPNTNSRAAAILTEVDLKCDEAITAILKGAFPETVIISEEAHTNVAPGWHEESYIWYVDPIDGTLSYTEGTGTFGVSIALVRNGKPILGVITNPVMGLTAWGAEGLGAELNGETISFDHEVPSTPRLILSIGQDRSRSYSWARKYLLENELTMKRSAVTKTLHLLKHDADFYFSLPNEVFHGGKPSIWDLAGAAAIVLAAGGVAVDIYGNELVFKGPDLSVKKGHLFCHPDLASPALANLGEAIEAFKLSVEMK